MMKKFMVLYLSRVSAREQMARATPEQIQAGMAEWMKWREKVQNAIIDFGSPLEGGKHIESGNVSAGELTITGYSIVQANSIDDAGNVVDGIEGEQHLLRNQQVTCKIAFVSSGCSFSSSIASAVGRMSNLI